MPRRRATAPARARRPLLAEPAPHLALEQGVEITIDRAGLQREVDDVADGPCVESTVPVTTVRGAIRARRPRRFRRAEAEEIAPPVLLPIVAEGHQLRRRASNERHDIGRRAELPGERR